MLQIDGTNNPNEVAQMVTNAKNVKKDWIGLRTYNL
jgi:hypothetical protein